MRNALLSIRLSRCVIGGRTTSSSTSTSWSSSKSRSSKSTSKLTSSFFITVVGEALVIVIVLDIVCPDGELCQQGNRIEDMIPSAEDIFLIK